MSNKYELTDETKVVYGVTLRRIRALIAIGTTVAAGQLGGWVEGENNLDQSGNAWVYSDAQVSGNAQVYGNAWVYGDARVSGNARVFGDARVFGNARVSGDRDVFWVSNVGTENGTLTVFAGEDGPLVTRGCFLGTPDEFLAKSAKVHGEKTQREYRLLIEVALSRLSRDQE